ncbi:MAG TPA: hypothetical protein IGS52_02390, partial [Oscillatoriaceae cyanobacterium M33_DOE_052]|nr:hypothetical protein [Oscillatoriaceae cyanobacterium M33_DOE_052]
RGDGEQGSSGSASPFDFAQGKLTDRGAGEQGSRGAGETGSRGDGETGRLPSIPQTNGQSANSHEFVGARHGQNSPKNPDFPGAVPKPTDKAVIHMNL